MQENEFEKRMKQQMDTFRLQPDEKLWQNIQPHIAKEKERKRKYIIFSFLLLLFSGSVLWISDLKQHPVLSGQRGKNKIEGKLSPAPAENNLTQKFSKERAQQPAFSSAGDKYGSYKEPLNTITSINNKIHLTSLLKRTAKGVTKIKISTEVISESDVSVNKDLSVQNNQLSDKNSVQVNSEKEKKPDALNNIILKEQDKVDPVKERNKKDDVAKTTASAAKKKLWATGFSLDIGISSATNMINAINTATAYNGSAGTVYNPAGTANYNDNIDSNNAGQGNLYHSSSARHGLSFTAGLTISRSLSAKTSAVIGLQYQLLTTSIATGEKVNAQSSGGNREIFQSGSKNSYLSFYHFITIPVSLTTSIASIKTRSLNLNAGLNFSKLIYTNALQFDNAQGYYYKDNSFFNKMLIGFSTAASINLAGENKKAFCIGPYFYYSLTPQAVSGMYKQSHYRSFGIQVEKMLK